MATSKNPFADKDKAPTTATLAEHLAGAYPAFEAVCLHAKGYAQSWNWAKYSGWVLKAAARGKSLFYLIPAPGAFTLSMALRETERDALARDSRLLFAREKLDAAKKYKEGYAVQIEVNEINAEKALAFLDALAALRA